jgi:prepilin-type N-terminal cleavage/methylation domain-containing protein
MQYRSMKPKPSKIMRRAFTLIEMLVVLTVGSAAIGIAISALFALMRTERVGRERIPQVSVLSQLAEQYRNDAHSARQTTIDDTTVQQHFDLADGRSATYCVGTDAVERLERSADKKIRRETYFLPEGTVATFTVDSKSTPSVASILMASNPDAATKRTWQIAAILGQDHRFESTTGEGK